MFSAAFVRSKRTDSTELTGLKVRAAKDTLFGWFCAIVESFKAA
jgi:hypothetical protein